MYESPIQLYLTDIQTQIVDAQEKTIWKAVQNLGVDVDREELIRALKYDREQYAKGYNDAMESIVRCKDCINYNTMGCSNGFGWCEAWQQGRADESFCDCGERK